jgi:hypothetical protein
MGLAFVAGVTVLLLLFFTNPELLDKVWLWMVGLAGYIIILLEKGVKSLSMLFDAKETQLSQPPLPASQNIDEDIQAKIEGIEDRILQLETKLMKHKNL